jgi:hypothetical protein
MNSASRGEDSQWRLTREAMDHAGLTSADVWLRYFGLSGEAGEYEVDAYLNGLLTLPPVQRDLLSHAVNELSDGTPGQPRAPYSGPGGEGLPEPPEGPEGD